MFEKSVRGRPQTEPASKPFALGIRHHNPPVDASSSLLGQQISRAPVVMGCMSSFVELLLYGGS
eukprot:1160552-Pelagomonas_calceolata.AAC.13